MYNKNFTRTWIVFSLENTAISMRLSSAWRHLLSDSVLVFKSLIFVFILKLMDQILLNQRETKVIEEEEKLVLTLREDFPLCL